jgi:hypothetical protein
VDALSPFRLDGARTATAAFPGLDGSDKQAAAGRSGLEEMRGRILQTDMMYLYPAHRLAPLEAADRGSRLLDLSIRALPREVLTRATGMAMTTMMR